MVGVAVYAFWAYCVIPVMLFTSSSFVDGKKAPVRPTYQFQLICDKLENIFLEQGFMHGLQRQTYCEEDCSFASINCEERINVEDATTLRDVIGSTISGAFEGIRTFFEGPEDFVLDFEVGLALRTTWLEIGLSFAPILLSCIPILLNQYKYYSFWRSVIVMIMYIILHIGGRLSPMMTFHNCIVAVLCVVLPAGSSALIETAQTFVPLTMVIFSIFIPHPVFQMCVLFLTIILFFFFLYYTFLSKRQSHLSILLGLVQILVLWEQLNYVRQQFAEISIVGAGLELFIRAVLPNGSGHIWFVNLINFAKMVANKLPYFAEAKLYSFIVLVLLQIVMFLGFRAAIGQYCMMSLRFKIGFTESWEGLLVYMCDFYGPFRCLFRVVFGFEKANRKRISYTGVFICIMVYELHCATEFLFVRFVMSTIDYLIIKSGKARATKYLGHSLDMMQQSFPQEGSFPWLSIDEVYSLREYVCEVVAVKDHTTKGIGIVLLVANKVRLFTVKHVVDKAKKISFLNVELTSPVCTALTSGSDPVVTVDVPKFEGRPPDCPVLLKHEARFVKHLMFINVCEDDSYVSFIPPTNFSLKGDELSASVDLRPGDSGGPCFAVLVDGSLRYCGAVSRGRRNSGAGNIVAFVYGDEDLGSDSDSDPELGNTRDFNRARRVTFASEESEDARRDSYGRLVCWLNENQDEILSLWKYFEGYSCDPNNYGQSDLNFSYWMNHLSLDSSPPRTGDNPEGEGENADGSKGQKKKKRQERSRKDRAAWKRRMLYGEALWEKLTHVYSRHDAKKIFKTIFNDGNWPNLDAPGFVNATDGSGWLYADNLPDRKWT